MLLLSFGNIGCNCQKDSKVASGCTRTTCCGYRVPSYNVVNQYLSFMSSLKSMIFASYYMTIYLFLERLMRAWFSLVRQRWRHPSEQIPNLFKLILQGQAASAEGCGSELKYTISGVRACRLECGLRVL